ncbi:class I SAM-dependent RNA methyltransferase [Microbacterium sp. YY-01]|uniref:class I SAM-dependent RNA methyltransferase n=1 Tax=Microbacterium sp. YY-01 TaxID=3421634 RepID=UPI003D17BE66
MTDLWDPGGMTDALIDLTITGIAHGGTAVGRHDGRVVFVADAIPGERVRARVTDTRRDRFWRAEAVDVLEPSADRRPHVWPEADISRDPAIRPGGADFGHMTLEHQRALKQRVLQEALDRFADGRYQAPTVEGIPDSDEVSHDPSQAGLRWRTRMTVHVDDDGHIGPFATRSHRVIAVDDYPLAATALADKARALAARAARGETITINGRRVRAGDRIDLILDSDGGVHVLHGKQRAATETIQQRVGERVFELDAAGFWQVHPHAASTLSQTVTNLLRDRVDADHVHLDLYGGVGLLAAALFDAGAHDVVTVESDRHATQYAAANLAGHEVQAVTARVDKFLAAAQAEDPIGAVVLDPPRQGAGRAVVDGVAALHPDAVVYVACDPVALARDLGYFHEHGWRARQLQAFDLFPHSHHFETIALLERQ